MSNLPEPGFVQSLRSQLAARDRELAEADAAMRPVVNEAKNKCGDFHHLSWNPDAHVELTLTIKEIRRIVAFLARRTPANKETER